MNPEHITLLRQMLEDIDARLLRLLTGPHPLDDDALQKVATLESARGAVHRLLAAIEREGQP
jgi:hypothetical protein